MIFPTDDVAKIEKYKKMLEVAKDVFDILNSPKKKGDTAFKHKD